MQTPAIEINQMIVQLNEFHSPQLTHGELRRVPGGICQGCVPRVQRSTALVVSGHVNRFWGSDDRKDSLVDIFDPGMYTCDHPAWEALPGTWIEMPTLTPEVARLVDRNSINAAPVYQRAELTFSSGTNRPKRSTHMSAR